MVFAGCDKREKHLSGLLSEREERLMIQNEEYRLQVKTNTLQEASRRLYDLPSDNYHYYLRSNGPDSVPVFPFFRSMVEAPYYQ